MAAPKPLLKGNKSATRIITKKRIKVIINAAYSFWLGWRQNPCDGSTQPVRRYLQFVCLGLQSLPGLVQPQLQAVEQIMAAEGAAFISK